MFRSALRSFLSKNSGKKEKSLIKDFFFYDYYLRTNPDVAIAQVDPFQHYLTYGWREGRQPNPYFHPKWYLYTYPDVAAAGTEPLLHFVTVGVTERRNPHYLIDIGYYLAGAPDVAAAGVNPYLHYIQNGDREGRSAHQLFDPNFYKNNGSSIGNSAPFAHYSEIGAKLLRSPCPAFDPFHYISIYPDEADDPLMRFLMAPKQRPHFHPLLDGSYQSLTAERSARGANPLIDYMQFRSHFHKEDLTRGATFVPQPSAIRIEKADIQYYSSSFTPKLSVIVPCYNSDELYLRECVESIIDQDYENWELILVDDGSPDESTWFLIQQFSERDARIKPVRLEKNQNISRATNEGVKHSEGDYLVFIDHDDVVTFNAFSSMIRKMSESDADVAYSDQAFIGQDGEIGEPFLKADWSPALFAGVMYVGHLLIVRKNVAISAGLFDSRFDGCQDYEFMLRVSEKTDKIIHVPEILYYWRRSETSVASNSDVKGKIEPKQALAVAEHFKRVGFKGRGDIDARVPHRLRLRPLTRHENVVVDFILHGVEQFNQEDWIDALRGDCFKASSVTHSNWQNSPFNCVALGKAPWIIFMDPRAHIIDGHWFSSLLMHAERDDAAFVSAHVYTPEGQVVSAGKVASADCGLLDAYVGFKEGEDGAWGSLFCDREVTAVGAICTLISRATLERIGGLSPSFVTCDGAVGEAAFKATYLGLRNVSVASPIIQYPPLLNEAQTFAKVIDQQLFMEKHGDDLAKGDRYYNKNYASNSSDFSVVGN